VIVNEFYLNSQDEVIVKLINEALGLFKIEIKSDFKADYKKISIENAFFSKEDTAEVLTKISLEKNGGTIEKMTRREKVGLNGRRQAAEERRLVKKNVYEIFLELTKMPPAPWGILQGVRPTKIVHKRMKSGMARDEIIAQLIDDYCVSREKAELLVDVACRQQAVLTMSDERTVSIYIGIPFCPSRCLYCSFTAYVLPNETKLQTFMETLYKDLDAAAEIVERKGLKVQSIYIGGGTPTSLPDAEFAALLDRIDRFYQPSTLEYTVEAGRPDSVSDFKIAAMKRHKVNRVSVNPQTMQQKTLNYIGRKHTVEAIIELFHKFRAAEMANINMDLIIGLPGETLDDVKDTLDKVIALKPNDITIHALALKKGSRLKMNLDEYPLPDDEAVQEMFALALKSVEANGYIPYYLYRQGYMRGNMENIGCAKKGAEGIYNIQIMEEEQTVIGIGAGAATKIFTGEGNALKSSYNAKDLLTYLSDIDRYIKKRAALLDSAF
jgi:oxygen-independent coproporphyrinogen-3 oxidase